MTTGGPLGERSVTAPQLLDLCDRALGEVSRRRHLFGWLRAPGAEEWLAVDGYYPGNRLVVVCCDEPTADDELIAERVAEHGLRLLALAPEELAADPAGVDAALRRRLDQLGPPPPRPRALPVNGERGPVAKTVAALAQREPVPQPRRQPAVPPPAREAVTRGAEFVATHRVKIDQTAHAAAISRHRKPIRRSSGGPIRRGTSGPAGGRARALAPAARRHPVAAALLIAGLVIVVVVAVAIVAAGHGG
ncbi:MAG TPA: hypothetical protein VG410_14375 [Solirubrobacteraceae bacterium]|nr:hypothetical protein [Solirubrobacteraceae bacterium]